MKTSIINLSDEVAESASGTDFASSFIDTSDPPAWRSASRNARIYA